MTDVTVKVETTKVKTDKWDYIKMKSFSTAKEIINREKRQPMEREKIFANHIYGKGFISKIHKVLLQFKSKKTKNLIKK